ncbi:MAG: sugar-binding protein, partial [Thermoanaerobaculia bacterium]
LYYCPRIDLVPPGEGGPHHITLDGILDEPVWELARFQKWSVNTGGRDFAPPEEDLDLSWAAVADENFLYVAWRVVDEARQSAETFFCDVWRDDSVEVYLDTKNDGPVCPGGASCYGVDDAQITVGADQIGKFDPIDPEALEFGGVAGKGACDFAAPAPELCKGVAQELESEEGFAGWQAEIAIALDTMGNGDDGTPEWHLTPIHGTTIGWNIHVNDDDNGGERDHKLLWSKAEVTETAWQNPGAFGKLQFVAPGKALAVVARDLPGDLQNGGSGTVTITVTPTFGKGIVVIQEKLPASLTPSSPSEGGVLSGDTITWDLGKVEAVRVLTYRLAVAADAADVALPGTATIDGEPLPIIGDAAYTGSPISVDGFIKLWSHLGPLASGFAGGATCDPGADLGLDWIVDEDGSIDQTNIRPFPGLITRPRYGGDGQPGGTGARAAGLIVRENNVSQVVQDRFPVWRGSLSP